MELASAPVRTSTSEVPACNFEFLFVLAQKYHVFAKMIVGVGICKNVTLPLGHRATDFLELTRDTSCMVVMLETVFLSPSV